MNKRNVTCYPGPGLIDDVVSFYNVHGYVLMKDFISADLVGELLDKLESYDGRKVICGQEDVSWEEKSMQDGSLFELFSAKDIIKFVTTVSAEQETNLLSYWVWASIYRGGEFINPHRDKSGTTQLLICLKNVSYGGGGTLFLNDRCDESVSVHLKPGDAILFRASELLHWTDPIVSAFEDPSRIVLVSRYFFKV